MDDLEKPAGAAKSYTHRALRWFRESSRSMLIEQTDKRWKAIQLLGNVIFFLGAAGYIGAVSLESDVLWSLGVILAILGLVITGIGSTLAWWYHG